MKYHGALWILPHTYTVSEALAFVKAMLTGHFLLYLCNNQHHCNEVKGGKLLVPLSAIIRTYVQTLY